MNEAAVVTLRAVWLLALAFTLSALPVRAERSIVDPHRLDAYFALFAGDSNVPWKPTAVRLDTYSSAPVLFSVYQVDPIDVLTAGSNARPRAISTRGRRPVVSFTFTPPGGYQFQSNEIDVQLGSREGFFVVEARRGDVGEQVWINRTRVGLVSKETPGALLVYGTDLGTGRALPRMRVQFVVNDKFETTATDGNGMVQWRRSPRPVFALAQWGNSYAFLSLLPQAPLPTTIVGVRLDSAVVHAGDTVRIVGFARSRAGNALRPSGGSANVSLRLGARLVGERRVPLDAAGAFETSFAVPATAAAGDYAVLAQVDDGVGGATVHVDANAAGLSLDAAAPCGGSCDPNHDVPLTVRSSRGDAIVHVTVVRSPHVYVGYVSEDVPWATTIWIDESIRTGADGAVTVTIPRPNDELASTYGVRVESGGATADTRIVVPTSRAAVRLQLDRDEQTLATPVGFDVYANDVADREAARRSGRHRAPRARRDRRAATTRRSMPTVTRAAASMPAAGNESAFRKRRDARHRDGCGRRARRCARSRLGAGRGQRRRARLARKNALSQRRRRRARRAGAAIVRRRAAHARERARRASQRGRRRRWHARAHYRASDATGELRVGAAFVRDGAIEWTTVPLLLEAPGRPQLVSLAIDGTEASRPVNPRRCRSAARRRRRGTVVVRISRGEPSGSALFDSAPALLAIGLASTQSSAPAGVTWHPWVDSTGDHAQVLGFVRRTQPPQGSRSREAETQVVSWSVVRAGGDAFAVQMPAQSGRYTLSVLEISDDGRVSRRDPRASSYDRRRIA